MFAATTQMAPMGLDQMSMPLEWQYAQTKEDVHTKVPDEVKKAEKKNELAQTFPGQEMMMNPMWQQWMMMYQQQMAM